MQQKRPRFEIGTDSATPNTEMERRKERRLAGCGSSPVSSPTHRKLGLKGVLLRVWCTTCCGRNAKCAQRDVAQHALSTHPSGQGAQWPWADRPLWVPAGQGLGVTVPAGQKCPEREADQICQSHSKPHSLHPEGPQPKPSPWRAQGTAGGLWSVAASELAHFHLPRTLLRAAPGGTCRARATNRVSQ